MALNGLQFVFLKFRAIRNNVVADTTKKIIMTGILSSKISYNKDGHVWYNAVGSDQSMRKKIY